VRVLSASGLRRSASPRQAFSLFLPILFLTGCGYRLAGRGDLIPATVKTIAVQPFGNATPKYKLARLLPSDISREFIARTRYRLVDDANQADAVLTGTLVGFSAYPIVSADNRGTTVQVVVNVQVKLTNRATGAVIWERPGAEYRERYEIALDPASYFDESGTAIERLSKDVSRSVVSAILNAF
jgi:hypothetical protein